MNIATGFVFSGNGTIDANVNNAGEVDVNAVASSPSAGTLIADAANGNIDDANTAGVVDSDYGNAGDPESGPPLLVIVGNYTQTAGVTNLNGNDLEVSGGDGTSDLEQDGGAVADNGTVAVDGDYNQNGGTFTLTTGMLIADNVAVGAGGLLSGTGSIYADSTNADETAFTGGIRQVGAAVSDGGEILADGDYLLNSGSLTLSAGALDAGNVNVAVVASLSGDGEVYANLNNAGAVQGDALTLAVSGVYDQTAGSTDVPGVLTVGNGVQQSGGPSASKGR